MTPKRTAVDAPQPSKSDPNHAGATLRVDPLVSAFPVAWVPIQTAHAVLGWNFGRTDERDAEPCVVALAKIFDGDNPESEVDEGAPLRGRFTESLSMQDWQNAISAWAVAGLPPLKLPIPEAAFEDYRRAFQTFGPQPPFDFELETLIASRGSDSQNRLLKVQADHAGLLAECILQEVIRPRDPVSNVPRSRSLDPVNVLTYEDLQVFASKISVKVTRAPLGAYWLELPMPEQKRALLREYVALGGRFIGNTSGRERSSALTELCKLDGRNRSTVEDHVVAAREEELRTNGIAPQRSGLPNSSVFHRTR